MAAAAALSIGTTAGTTHNNIGAYTVLICDIHNHKRQARGRAAGGARRRARLVWPGVRVGVAASRLLQARVRVVGYGCGVVWGSGLDFIWIWFLTSGVIP